MKNVPFYDELSVKNLWPIMKKDKEFMLFFPDQLPKGRLPDREYFFNILNTLNEPYVGQLVEHAHLQRATIASKHMEQQSI